MARSKMRLSAAFLVCTSVLWGIIAASSRSAPSDPPVEYPLANFMLEDLVDYLSTMGDDLGDTWFSGWSCGVLQGGLPEEIQGLPIYRSIAPLMLQREDGSIWTGTVDLIGPQSDGSVDFVFVLEDGGTTRYTLTQVMWVDGDTLHVWGELEVFTVSGGPATYAGGWTYEAADGPLEDPASESGFIDQYTQMFACSGTASSGSTSRVQGFSLGNIATLVGNVVSNLINYILDVFPPPDQTCEGPTIRDGAGETCENVNIPCSDKIVEMCGKIDDIPDVSAAFKRCMKGRCGCGGSRHGRLTITCDDSSSCGPCASMGSALGCNLGGSPIWYCGTPSDTQCTCANTVFHEMSHACNTQDLQNGSRADSYRIGDWFEDEFKSTFGSCDPVQTSAPPERE